MYGIFALLSDGAFLVALSGRLVSGICIVCVCVVELLQEAGGMDLYAEISSTLCFAATYIAKDKGKFLFLHECKPN